MVTKYSTKSSRRRAGAIWLVVEVVSVLLLTLWAARAFGAEPQPVVCQTLDNGLVTLYPDFTDAQAQAWVAAHCVPAGSTWDDGVVTDDEQATFNPPQVESSFEVDALGPDRAIAPDTGVVATPSTARASDDSVTSPVVLGTVHRPVVKHLTPFVV